jgi:hypothetical protein
MLVPKHKISVCDRKWIAKLLPDPEDIQKLLEIFLRIYEIFQNPGNIYNSPKKFPDPEKSEIGSKVQIQ